VLSFWSEAREALLVKRREFITLLGGVAAAAWPLAARAQQGVRQITVWMGRGNDAEGQRHAAAFRETLRALGWADGRNVRTHYHWVTIGNAALCITANSAGQSCSVFRARLNDRSRADARQSDCAGWLQTLPGDAKQPVSVIIVMTISGQPNAQPNALTASNNLGEFGDHLPDAAGCIMIAAGQAQPLPALDRACRILR
jgi:hypothetical protein